MGLAGDGAGRGVADTVTGAGPGQLEPTENQQELQPAACREHTKRKVEKQGITKVIRIYP